jgi:malonyl CoA-acyl carrier protein transacylase
LEEYTGDYLNPTAPALREWDAELVVCRQPTREKILNVMQQVQQGLARGGQPRLVDLAASIARGNSTDAAHPILAMVVATVEELREKLPLAMQTLRGTDEFKIDPRGVYFAAQPSQNAGGLAFLFPGQGSQYPNMLADVAIAFPVVREALDAADTALADRLPRPLGRYIYPPSTFDEAAERLRADELAQTNIAQPALAATSLAMFGLLQKMGAQPQFFAGHSSGEYVALAAAGCLSPQDLTRIAERRGVLMAEAGKQSAGAMAAVSAGEKQVQEALASLDGVTLANLNSPTQTVISGEKAILEKAIEQLKAAGLTGRLLPVSGAFHSPHVAAASVRLAKELRTFDWNAPTTPVYSNLTAAPHSTDPRQIVEQLVQHVASPVRFAEEIEALHAAGARVFVEVGPQGVLTGLVKQILGERHHVALATDLKGRPGLAQLAHTLAQMLIHGVGLDARLWFDQRVMVSFDLADLEKQSLEAPRSANTWLVNGIRARPLHAPEPMLLGQDLNLERWDAAAPNPRPTSRLQLAEAASLALPPTKTAGSNGVGSSAVATGAMEAGVSAPLFPATSNGFETLTHEVSSPMYSSGNNGDHHSNQHSNPLAPLMASADGVVDEATFVMCRYQDLMARFLDSQQAVLRDYFQTISGAPLSGGHAPLNEPLTSLPTQARSAIIPQAANASTAQESVATQPQPVAHTAAAQPQPGSGNQLTTAPVATIESNGNALHAQYGVVAVAPAAETALIVTREEMTKRLLELVCKRTGYPLEMLDLDLDLEADLGVDSIKRVEILGTLAESLGGKESDLGGRIEIEKLTILRTLRGILDYLDEVTRSDHAAAPAGGSNSVLTHGAASNGSTAKDAGSNGAGHHVASLGSAQKTPGNKATTNGHSSSSNGDANGDDASELKVQRGVIELIDVPLASSTQMSIPAGLIVITDDGRGVANQLAQRLADFGQKVACLRWGAEGVRQTREDLFEANFTDPQQVTELVALLRSKAGAIGALVHLAPLAELIADEPAERRAERDVKSLYLLARALEEDLCRAAEEGNAALLGATSLGGALGFEAGPLNSHYRAAHGGIAGFLKCIAQEWDEVLVRAVDLDLDLPADELADLLLAELADLDGPSEVGVSRGRRVTWQPVQADLAAADVNNLELEAGAPVLITGGARGITARVAVALAKRWRPHIILVGRSPLPAANEPADVAGLTDPAAIKKALIERFRVAGEPTAPAAIEAVYRKLLAEREVRGTLAEITAAGGSWEYHALDVRDSEAFGRLLDELNARGGVQGVIHGAGVIEDRLLRDKIPESFDRVFHTKVDSAFTLSRRLDPSKLRFCVLFASLASRYGNRGQSDYAAANEVLSKLAVELDRKWPGRVCSIAWGPWSGVGMVAELEPHLRRRGLKLIEPNEGPQFVLDEISRGGKGPCEVIVAGGAERLVHAKLTEAAEAR